MTAGTGSYLRTIAVTGATGFIGSRLCDLLVARGVGVRAIVRGACPPRAGVTAVVAPLTEPSALGRALAGVDAVVHLAGRAHVLHERADPSEAFREVNVEGTRRLVEAAASAAVARVIFLSSVGAVATTAAHPVDDATPTAPDTPYGRSKLAAEGIVRAASAGMRGGHVILRPPMVFGPGMKGNPLRLFRAVDRGIPVPVGATRNHRSAIYVDNLVEAIMVALALPGEARDTFVVGDSIAVSSADLVREVAEALGRPARLLSIPVGALRIAGRAGDAIARLAPFPLTSDAVERLCGSLAVDYTRFARVTGYTPSVDRREAMRRTADWYRSTR